MLLQRILVVMPNWIGEALFAAPFLGALRAAHPGARLAALGVPRVQDVLRHLPGLDEALLYDEEGAHRSLPAKWALAGLLRRGRFDAAFLLRRSASRTALAWAAGIPARIGFANAKSGWLLTHRLPRPPGARHKAEAYLGLLSGLGLATRPAPYRYHPTEPERREAAAWLRAQGLEDGRRLIVLHPGANWPHKRWAPERFAEAADRLARDPQRRIALTGAGEDRPLVEQVRSRMAATPLVLAGKTSLPQMAACLSWASVMISNDTGVLHLAAAVGTPVVALFGPTSPALVGPLGEPARTRVLHHAESCPQIPCYHPDHPSHPGMNAISVDEVCDAAEHLLGRGKWEGGSGKSEEERRSLPPSAFRLPPSS